MTVQFPSGNHRVKDFVRIPQRKLNEPPGEYFISKQSLSLFICFCGLDPQLLVSSAGQFLRLFSNFNKHSPYQVAFDTNRLTFSLLA